jgi:plasmid stabilization system protein ParE
MARKVIWTEVAWRDLEEAADYIAEDSPHYAAALVREVREAARSLAYLAERGRVVPEFEHPKIRELIVRSYRLIYRVAEEAVHIIGFIHGARDLETLWRRKVRGDSGDRG